MNRSARMLIHLAATLTMAAAGQAQTAGRIVGTIVDGGSGVPLVGAYVIVQGTPFGAASDLEGDFRVSGLSPGSYVIESSMLGYNKTTVIDVEVSAGDVTRLDLVLLPKAIEVDEVVVRARALRNTEAALLKERQKAPAVSDAISAEDISRAGSGDAAEAMALVTGATVTDGRYVAVRGLGGRYSTVHLNGTDLPSADPDRRAVAMDMFPASMLENIVTVKSFTPDRPGNSTGGAVNIGTRSMPDGYHLTVSSSTTYNSNSTFREVLSYDGGSTDWLGADDGTRDVPDELVAEETEIPSYGSVFSNDEAAADLDRLSAAFSNVMAPTETTAPLNSSTSIALGNQVSLGGRPLGFLGSVSFSRSRSHYDRGTMARWTLTGNVEDTHALTDELNLRDTKTTEEALWGGLMSTTYRPHDKHELGATAIYNRSGQDVARYLTGAFDETLDPETTYETRVLHYTEREIRSLQLTGKHHFDALAGLRVEWSGSGVESSQEEPDLRYFSDNYVTRNGRVLYSIKPSSYPDPTRYFRTLDESNREAKVDATLSFAQWQGLSSQLKFGGFFQTRDRTFAEQRYQYQRPSSHRYEGDAAAFFGDGGVGIIDDSGPAPRFGNYIIDATELSNQYEGDQQIYAGYGMAELPLTRALRLITGARLESTRMDVASANPELPPGQLQTDDLLPSINLVHQFGEANVRASYGRTLARPTFRELAPFSSFAFVGDFILTGNEELERTLVDNYDLRWEWFPGPGEIYAVSGFWKDFTNPIERAILTVNGEVQYQNVDQARVLGLEIEGRKQLNFLGDRWRNFFAGGNLALIHSRVDIPETELAVIRAYDADADDSRSLEGQSPYVLNLDVTYDSFETNTSAGLYYNLFGRRLAKVSLGGTPNVYEEARGTLDFTMSKGFAGPYSLKLSAKNLLDPDISFVYPYKGTDFTSQNHRRGRSFSLSVSYKTGG